MTNKLTVDVEGYGEIKVRRPKEFTEDTFDDGVAEAVAKVMNLLRPGKQRKRFHPVLGLGGYESHDNRGTSRREPDAGTD